MEKIKSETKSLTYELDGGSIPLELKESDLSVKSSEGTLWYDPDLKQVVETTEAMTIVGTMKFLANGQELPAELDLTMKIKSTMKR